MKLTIELSEEQLESLRVLDAQGRAEVALDELVARVVDGVTRPGSWERPWLTQALGDEWQARLEADPEAWWRQRPR